MNKFKVIDIVVTTFYVRASFLLFYLLFPLDSQFLHNKGGKSKIYIY